MNFNNPDDEVLSSSPFSGSSSGDVDEAVDDEDDTIDIIDQLSVGSLPFRFSLYVDFEDTAQFYAALLGQHLH